MKIIIETKSNGIHDYATINIDINLKEPLDFFPIEKIINVIRKYNKEQIEKA